MKKMKLKNKVMEAQCSTSSTGSYNTTATAPAIYERSVATMTHNPFESIDIQLSDMRAMLRILLEQREPVVEKSDLMNFKDACQMTGASKSTMYKLTSSNRIPVCKRMGSSKLLFSRKAIESWMNEVQPTTADLMQSHFNLMKTHGKNVRNN